jgi:triosephosphate isomerase
LRTPLIAGNWKMYKTASEAAAFVRAFLPMVVDVADVEIVLAPAFTSLSTVAALTAGARIAVAAQNVHYENEGAFTGEVSPKMLREAGVTHAIIGHSERRQYFAETDATVNLKVKASLVAGLTPILCLGETLSEREAGQTFAVIERQLRGGLDGIPASDAARVVIAYEPVWAIGTGRTATPEQAQEVHGRLRALLADTWNEGAADSVRILYGGSVNPGNVKALMAQPDVDGGLVGGASLKPDSFSEIVKFR